MNKTALLLRRIGMFDGLLQSAFRFDPAWNASKRRRYAQGYNAGTYIINKYRAGTPMDREEAVRFVNETMNRGRNARR